MTLGLERAARQGATDLGEGARVDTALAPLALHAEGVAELVQDRAGALLGP